ncbi:hypothetical protein MRB53_041889 [Persea americana]|nr:hypothetical protein MRB53_041889 [Persea americana]
MSKIIDRLYGQNVGARSANVAVSDLCKPIAELEKALSDWRSCLPEGLKPMSQGCSSKDFPYTRLRTILTLRYNNIRCLLHRPVLTAILAAGGEMTGDSYQPQYVRDSMRLIVETSLHTVTVISDVDGSKASLGAYWFSIFYRQSPTASLAAKLNLAVFNASLLLFAAGLGVQHESREAYASQYDLVGIIQGGLRQAVNVLPRLDAGNSTIEKCQNYLKLLMARDLLTRRPATKLVPGTSPQIVGSNARLDLQLADPTMHYATTHGQDLALDDLDLGQFMMSENFEFLRMPLS